MTKIEILPGIELKNKALWLKKQKILVIGDLHLGYEEALNQRGVFIPRIIFTEIKKQILELLELNPREVILLGDLKHEFSQISNQEWTDTINLIELILKKSKLILIKGNHDSILGPITKKKSLEILPFYYLNKERILFIHGNKIILDKELYNAKTIILGHEHPAIELKEGEKKEKYKCFLLGKWKKKQIVVVPSFLPVLGVNVLKEKFLSPFLKQTKKDIEKFKIFIIQNKKIYSFGRIKEIRKLLN